MLRDGELKYDIMEKQEYALIKALKDFRIYILHSHIIAHVPSATAKGILTQPDPEGRRAKWIATLLEYDIKIKPTKLIKGQGLAKMMANSNCEALQINFISHQANQLDTEVEVMVDFVASSCYSDIVYVLRNLQAPEGLSKSRGKSVKLKAAKFCIINRYLYWKDPGGVLLNFFLEDEAQQITKEFHQGDCGGHHSWKVTANKILRAGYYWPTLFSDVYKEISKCHQFQIFDGKRKVLPIPLNPITVEVPFQ